MDLPIDDDVNSLILLKDFDLNIVDYRHLEHASICEYLDCPIETCMMMKSYIQHFTNCLDMVYCDKCDFYFIHVRNHFMNCSRKKCSTFLCELIAQVQSNISSGTVESIESTNPGTSSSEPVFQEGCRNYRNLTEKLINFVKMDRILKNPLLKSSSINISSSNVVIPPYIPSTYRKFFQQPKEENLPVPQFAFQQNAPGTSREFFQQPKEEMLPIPKFAFQQNAPSTSMEFFQQPKEEMLPIPKFAFQRNAPGTSGKSFQDQSDTEHRNKRFKKEHIDDTIVSMDLT
ncbi:hypothetical protein TNIN_224411 [Trichonephila inaurata madagascariensis]|uniref:TAZ-type domain-containing protein n=1 Tax=Trichonephila inaurata madagascariensis TaxID=2747483 RepID=A0A8X7CGE6_9ARAC|nr:hypothetical protein TNIN_224411 [Trichonephila inaurata madagascariensis]